MSCSPKSPTATPERRAEGLVGRDVSSTSIPAKSDLSDWVDLMDAIEALCPVWPEHQPRKGASFSLRTGGVSHSISSLSMSTATWTVWPRANLAPVTLSVSR